MTESETFKAKVIDFERTLIREALLENEKMPSRAARALGFSHHQSLLLLLNTRHRPLRDELGIVARVRRKPIINARQSKHASVRESGNWDREAL